MTTILIIGWLTLGDLWALYLLPPEAPNEVTKIEIRNDRGESIIIRPQKPYRCTVKEAEWESVFWQCSGPGEIVYRPRKEDAYFWVGGINGQGGFKGGMVGGGWRVVR